MLYILKPAIIPPIRQKTVCPAIWYNGHRKIRKGTCGSVPPTEWSPVSKKRSATYTNLDPGEYVFRVKSSNNLDPGEYVFRVKSSNNDGLWNQTGKSLRIVITPPLWETRWFQSGLAVVFLALVSPSGMVEIPRF